VPRHDDVRTFPPPGGDERWKVDMICGGFPCCQISNSRTAQVAIPEGLEGKDSGLWFEFARVVRRMRPRWVVVENVGALSTRGLDRVLRGLAAAGYDAEWATISAGALGAPHLRKRTFIIAIQDAHGAGLEGHVGKILAQPQKGGQHADAGGPAWWDSEPGLGRVADGVPSGVDGPKRYPEHTKGRLMALGNAVVPLVAEFIGRRIMRAAEGV
jgi:DNA (cytosine-5)-methyltransferase 1